MAVGAGSATAFANASTMSSRRYIPSKYRKKNPKDALAACSPCLIAPLLEEDRGEPSHICRAAKRREAIDSLNTRSSAGASGVG